MLVVRVTRFLLPAFLAACSGFVERDSGTELVAVHGDALGTTWSIKWIGGADKKSAVRASVTAELGRLDSLMSTWRSDSELSALNRSTGVQPVSTETLRVIRDAMTLSKETHGAFDPTVEPLMEFWGLRGTPRSELPTVDELAVVRSRVGYEKVQLDATSSGDGTIDLGGTNVDLSAIAKGTAVDWVAVVLQNHGIQNFMVEIGGEMVVEGGGVTGEGWRVAVDDPTKTWPDRAIGLTLQLRSGAIATSGNYRNRYVVNGLTVVHTMDPRTGRPRESPVLSATVVGRDCQTADGAATALMVMSFEDGKRWIQSRSDLEAAWFVSDTAGIHLQSTEGMQSRIQFVDDRFRHGE